MDRMVLRLFQRALASPGIQCTNVKRILHENGRTANIVQSRDGRCVNDVAETTSDWTQRILTMDKTETDFLSIAPGVS